jgi:hypothetical protein
MQQCRSCGSPSTARSSRPATTATWRLARSGTACIRAAGAARTSYSEDTYRRLVALKNTYDPTNLFRLNQNIEPSGAGA